jgi:hypothetical protein
VGQLDSNSGGGENCIEARLLAHSEGKSGGRGAQRGGGVLRHGGRDADSPETMESMVFAAVVLCTTRVMDISVGG